MYTSNCNSDSILAMKRRDLRILEGMLTSPTNLGARLGWPFDVNGLVRELKAELGNYPSGSGSYRGGNIPHPDIPSDCV